MVPSVTLNQDGRYLSRLVSAQRQTSNYIKLQNARTHYLTHADSEWRLFIPSSLCFICVCVCESMLRFPRASTREFKRTLYSSFSLLLNNNHRAVVPPRTSYVLPSACSRVRTHKTNKHVQLYTRWHTNTEQPTCTKPRTHPTEPWDYCAISTALSPGKNMFFYFISFLSTALPLTLPPSSLSFLTQQHVALPRLLCWNHRPHPVLRQQLWAAGPVMIWVCTLCVCELTWTCKGRGLQLLSF